MKKAKIEQTDEQLKRRCEKIKEQLSKQDENYIDFKDYYIEIRRNGDGAGIRWFHRNKYKAEVVFDRDSGPAQDVAGFVLFSNIDDAILHACLCEQTELRRLTPQRI